MNLRQARNYKITHSKLQRRRSWSSGVLARAKKRINKKKESLDHPTARKRASNSITRTRGSVYIRLWITGITRTREICKTSWRWKLEFYFCTWFWIFSVNASGTRPRRIPTLRVSRLSEVKKKKKKKFFITSRAGEPTPSRGSSITYSLGSSYNFIVFTNHRYRSVIAQLLLRLSAARRDDDGLHASTYPHPAAQPDSLFALVWSSEYYTREDP